MTKLEANRYYVIKIQDMKSCLSEEDQQILETLLTEIACGRERAGKTPFNSYVVCNLDEPYAEKVWQTILAGEYEKNNL